MSSFKPRNATSGILQIDTEEHDEFLMEGAKMEEEKALKGNGQTPPPHSSIIVKGQLTRIASRSSDKVCRHGTQ